MDYKSVSEDGIWQEKAYQEASAAFYSAESRADYLKAKSLLSKLHGYSDTENMINVCDEKVAAIDERDAYEKAEELIKNGSSAELREALTILDALEDFRGVDWLRKEAKGKLFRKNITFLLILVSVIMFAGGAGLGAVKTFKIVKTKKDAKTYEEALSLFNKGKFKEASNLFSELNGYSNSTNLYFQCLNAPKYSKAVYFYEEGKYKEAIDLFIRMEDYKDSSKYLNKIVSEFTTNADKAIENHDYVKGLDLYSSLGTYSKNYCSKIISVSEHVMKTCKKGQQIFGKVAWGRFEQDGDEHNGEELINWDVYGFGNGRCLLVSSMVLDCRKYHNDYAGSSWAESSLCNWLNTHFISSFDAEKRKHIVPISLNGLDDGRFISAKSSSDACRIFLLTESELLKYFRQHIVFPKMSKKSYFEVRNVCPTNYAIKRKVSYDRKKGTACYWLRSETANCSIPYASPNKLNEGFFSVVTLPRGVRPAMIVDFN